MLNGKKIKRGREGGLGVCARPREGGKSKSSKSDLRGICSEKMKKRGRPTHNKKKKLKTKNEKTANPQNLKILKNPKIRKRKSRVQKFKSKKKREEGCSRARSVKDVATATTFFFSFGFMGEGKRAVEPEPAVTPLPPPFPPIFFFFFFVRRGDAVVASESIRAVSLSLYIKMLCYALSYICNPSPVLVLNFSNSLIL